VYETEPIHRLLEWGGGLSSSLARWAVADVGAYRIPMSLHEPRGHYDSCYEPIGLELYRGKDSGVGRTKVHVARFSTAHRGMEHHRTGPHSSYGSDPRPGNWFRLQGDLTGAAVRLLNHFGDGQPHSGDRANRPCEALAPTRFSRLAAGTPSHTPFASFRPDA
jgi:hypothetical protein